MTPDLTPFYLDRIATALEDLVGLVARYEDERRDSDRAVKALFDARRERLQDWAAWRAEQDRRSLRCKTCGWRPVDDELDDAAKALEKHYRAHLWGDES